jgi:hypothetical protein
MSSSSELSSLSSLASIDSDDALPSTLTRDKIDHYFKNGPAQPAKKKRPASPPHEYVLADNADIAVSYFFIRVLHSSKLSLGVAMPF